MNAITAHLEAMFDTYPRTPRVLDAKAELQAMMEDAYENLITAGVTPADAAGQVISEFGNLAELAPALGITTDTDRSRGRVEASAADDREGLAPPPTKIRNVSRVALIVLAVLAVIWLGIATPPLILAIFTPMPGWFIIFCGVAAGISAVALIFLIRLLRR